MATFESKSLFKTPTINIFGDIFCDIVASGVTEMPEFGADRLSKSISIFPGGSALNTSIHFEEVKRWRSFDALDLNFFSAVGCDLQGGICLRKLDEACINHKILRKDDERTGSCIVISGKDDRGFITDRGAIDNISLTWFEEAELMNCTHFHVGGFYNCKQLIHELPIFFSKAREQHITTSLNPQFDATEEWNGIEPICCNLSALICNEDEVKAIAKCDEIDKAASILLTWGCEIVVVTMGDKGAAGFLLSKENIDIGEVAMVRVFQKAPLVEEVVDTTGAGDAFAGAFLAEWVQTRNLRASLLLGCIAGSAAVTCVGGSTCSVSALEACAANI